MSEGEKSKVTGDSRFQHLDARDLPCGDRGRPSPVQLLATAGVALVVLFQVCVIVSLWIADIRRLPEVVADEPETIPDTDVASLEEAGKIPEPAPEVDEAIIAEPAPSPVEEDLIITEVTAVAPVVATESQVEVEPPFEKAPAEEPRQTDLLVLAKQEAEAGRFGEAERLVRREMEQSPDRVMAYVAMAKILERLERYEEALAMWDNISDRSAEVEVLASVSAERIRLEELIFANREAVVVESPAEEILISQGKEPEPPPVMEVVMIQEPASPQVTPEASPLEIRDDSLRTSGADDLVPRFTAKKKPDAPPDEKPPAVDEKEQVRMVKIHRNEIPTLVPVRRDEEPARVPPRIQIVEVDGPKIRDRDDDQFEEIRSIQVRIKWRKGAGVIDPKSVDVGLEFFDRDETTEAIVRSGITPKSTLKLESEWSTMEEERTLTYLYQVPNGFRDREFRKTHQRRTFYGFVVKVHYNGDFQDEKSSPDSLLSKSRELL